MKASQIMIHALLILASSLAQATPLGTAFTYQGQLTDGGQPANGSYDLRFILYNAPTNGTQIGSVVNGDDHVVSNGLFSMELDFGASAFSGEARWLLIAVRPGDSSGNYNYLSPRQAVTSTPYAVHALLANSASNLTGTVEDWQLSANIPRLYTSQSFTSTNHFNPPAGPPFTVASSTKVPNLNVDLLDGMSASAFWQLNGNNGTTAGTHFLGTTDDEPLEFKVAGERVLRLELNGAGTPNIIGGASANSVGTGTGSATIGGGSGNDIGKNAWNATIAGGSGNSIGDNASSSSIGGGQANGISTNSGHATIGGGQANHIVNSGYAVIGGGLYNWIDYDSAESTIGGGYQNVINMRSHNVTIAGGSWNNVSSNSARSTISGGGNNTIQSGIEAAVISGGGDNSVKAAADFATISGGYHNWIEGNAHDSTIGGGLYNLIDEDASAATVGGGMNNFIDPAAEYATISGGRENTILADGYCGTIAGGRSNEATNYAFAAGRRAKARHTGSFVWADSQDANFASSASNQFLIRAAGGVHLSDDTSMFFGASLRQMVNLWNTNYGIGVQNSTFYSRSGDRFCWYRNGTHTNAAVNPGTGGTWLMTLDGGGSLFTAGGIYPSSDRNVKTNFENAETREVLAQLVAIPIQTWSYKSEGAVRHIGPIAQDFRAAFGLGADDKHIATVDADGVALAAIQGLNQIVKEKEARITNLEKTVGELKALVSALNRKVNGGEQ